MPLLALLAFFLGAGCAEYSPPEQVDKKPAVVVPLDNNNSDQAFSGTTSDERPQIFFAEDISSTAAAQFIELVDLAVTTWGNYGPTEIYVVGIEESAAEELHEEFCERRRYSEDHCEDLYPTNEGMGYYQEIGELTGDSAATEAQWVAQWEQGVPPAHFFAASRPGTVIGLASVRGPVNGISRILARRSICTYFNRRIEGPRPFCGNGPG